MPKPRIPGVSITQEGFSAVDEGNGIYDSREGCNGIIETASNKLVAACKNTVIPETVTALGDYAIYKISGLTKLVLPEGLTTVGSHSIQDCPNLTSVVSHIQEPPTITSTNINGLASNCVLTVPRGKRDAYIAAGYNKIGTGVYLQGNQVIFLRADSAVKDKFKFADTICGNLGLPALPKAK